MDFTQVELFWLRFLSQFSKSPALCSAFPGDQKHEDHHFWIEYEWVNFLEMQGGCGVGSIGKKKQHKNLSKSIFHNSPQI